MPGPEVGPAGAGVGAATGRGGREIPSTHSRKLENGVITSVTANDESEKSPVSSKRAHRNPPEVSVNRVSIAGSRSQPFRAEQMEEHGPPGALSRRLRETS